MIRNIILIIFLNLLGVCFLSLLSYKQILPSAPFGLFSDNRGGELIPCAWWWPIAAVIFTFPFIPVAFALCSIPFKSNIMRSLLSAFVAAILSWGLLIQILIAIALKEKVSASTILHVSCRSTSNFLNEQLAIFKQAFQDQNENLISRPEYYS